MIRELYGTYSDAAFRTDRNSYLSCWSEDAVRVARDGECRGKAAIAAHWDEVWQILDEMAFFTEVSAIAVVGDRAVARVHCREIMVLKTGEIWKIVGRYEDELVKENGAWLFSRKHYHLLISEPQIRKADGL